jgi:hypothetical protein
MATIRPVQFSANPNVPTAPPDPPEWVRLVASGRPLNRVQRNAIADSMYGAFGQGSVYKLQGWRWDLFQNLRRYLVRMKNQGEFRPYYAPDKTALRNVLGSEVAEMIGPVPHSKKR